MAPGSVPAPPEEKGRGGPFVLFFLDILPRWEKGFLSGPWPPWHGRGESPSKIGSVSLSLAISAFSDSAPSPFLLYPEIRNSDWIETFATIFFPKISFLAAKVEHQPPYGWLTRVGGAPRGVRRAPLPRDHLGHRLAWIFLPILSEYSKNNLRPFLSRLDSV